MKSLLVTSLALIGVFMARAADPFAEGVRPTEPVSAEEQAKTFILPAGFKVELVVAEPNIQKPMKTRMPKYAHVAPLRSR